MISFDEFLKQDEADKYNMLQECNAIIQQKENIIKEVREYIETLFIEDYDGNSYYIRDKNEKELGIEGIGENILEILDKENK